MATNDIKTYNGEQIQLVSGRLVFSARSNDIYLNSLRYINLSAGVAVGDGDGEGNEGTNPIETDGVGDIEGERFVSIIFVCCGSNIEY